MAVLIACALGFEFYMESVSRASGLMEGYAAAAWANTPQGKATYQFAQAGNIDTLTRCDLPGWRIEKGACYPDQAPGGKLHGWRLKPDASARAGPCTEPRNFHEGREQMSKAPGTANTNSV